MRCLTAVSVIALLSTSAATAQQWTQEEIAAGVKKSEYTRFVPAGKSRTLENVTILNPDCTIAVDAEVTITKEPEHGSATIDDAEVFSSYGKDNPRSRCNDKKIKGHVLNYKPAPGYVGTDALELTLLHSNGQASLYVYTIKVLGGNKGRLDIRP